MIPIYVINLKGSTDRRAWMEAELESADVEGEFVSAVDGRRFAARCDRRNGTLTKGEAALILSHRVVWRKLLASAAEHAAVLEDDVHLGRNFRGVLDLDWRRYAADVVKLETWMCSVWLSRRSEEAGSRRVHRLGYEHLAAAAYIISRDGARKLLRATRRLTVQVDVSLFGGREIFDGEIHALQLVPAIAVQDNLHPNPAARREFASTLHEDRARVKSELRRNKPRGFGRLNREAARFFGQAWRWAKLSPTMQRKVVPWE